MSETYTPHQETSIPTPEEPSENYFAEVEAMQNNDTYQQEAARRARESFLNTASEPSTADQSENGWTTGQKIGAGIGITVGVGAVFAGGIATADHIAPQETIATASSTIQQGEGVEQAVDRSLGFLEAKGVDPADATMRQDVISQAVELTAENGVVQPGQSIEVEAKESPIFGNVTYEAVPVNEKSDESIDSSDLTSPDTH